MTELGQVLLNHGLVNKEVEFNTSYQTPCNITWTMAIQKKYSKMKGRKVDVIEYNRHGGIPVGKNIFYLCSICNSVIPSCPDEYTECKCGNVSVDIESARGGAKDISQLVILQIE